MSSDRIIELYDRRAADYDRERGRSLQEKAWLDRFLEYVPPSGLVLDNGFSEEAQVVSDRTGGDHTVWSATRGRSTRDEESSPW